MITRNGNPFSIPNSHYIYRDLFEVCARLTVHPFAVAVEEKHVQAALMLPVVRERGFLAEEITQNPIAAIATRAFALQGTWRLGIAGLKGNGASTDAESARTERIHRLVILLVVGASPIAAVLEAPIKITDVAQFAIFEGIDDRCAASTGRIVSCILCDWFQHVSLGTIKRFDYAGLLRADGVK